MDIIGKLKIVLVITAVLFFYGFLSAAMTYAATYWASPSGGAGTCAAASGATDPGQYRTAQQAVACATTGDTVILKSGTYTNLTKDDSNNVFFNMPSNLTFRGESPNPANWPVLRPQGSTSWRMFHFNNITRNNVAIRYIKIDYSDVSTAGSCLSMSQLTGTGHVMEDFECLGPPVGQSTSTGAGFKLYSTNWTVRRGIISRWVSGEANPGAHGFYVAGQNNIIEHNYIENWNGYCLQFWNSAKVASNNNTFRYNHCNGTRDTSSGIYIARGTNNVAHHNVIRNVGNNRPGIRIVESNNKAFNNTIVCEANVSRLGTSGFDSGIQSSTNEIKNNIALLCDTAINVSGPTLANNLTSGSAANIFQDHVNGNFALKSTAAEAINRGTNVGLPHNGSAPNIGALGTSENSASNSGKVTPPPPPSDLKLGLQ